MLVRVGDKFVNACRIVKIEPRGTRGGYTVEVVGCGPIAVAESNESIGEFADRVNAAIRSAG